MADESMQTLDQKRASHAWSLVENEVAKLPEAKRKEFGTQAKKLPMRILAAGLGQALAFLEAKSKADDKSKTTPQQVLLEGLADWMHHRRDAQGKARLVVRVIQGDADFLRFATAECLAYLQWVVRFADAQGLTDHTE
jgi:CRISPR-associated protein Cmr5